VLHEYYFDGLGGDGKPAGDVARALAAAFGSLDAWETEFRRTAMALSGGSGWAILTYNRHTRSLHNYWAWDHMHGAVTGEPLIALDMYEHSYHMDYGTQAAKYVDAVMANLDWETVDARYRAAIA
jgi:Fe-Mn family superoxide dismutase